MESNDHSVPSEISLQESRSPVGQNTSRYVCISLLGELHIWLCSPDNTRIPVPIKSHRRLQLLAYIATLAPRYEQRISSNRILTDVFEHILPGADTDSLRGLFQKHTQLLRKEVNAVAQPAGFPKVHLFEHEKVEASSTKWWLSAECQVVDLSGIRQLYERMRAAQKEEGEGLEKLAGAARDLIEFYQSFHGDYLEQHLLEKDFGDADWIQKPFTKYRNMYLQAVWSAAIVEHTRSRQLDLPIQERYKHARRAASLYKEYALRASQHWQFDLSIHKNRHRSEQVLRNFLRLCLWLLDTQAADECYLEYQQRMKEAFPDWKPDPETTHLILMTRQHEDENPTQAAPGPPEMA